jgi:uncharacterized DUF497 family protein
MGRIISPDGHFEWYRDKNTLNKENHGFYFEEIPGVFDDPLFLEAYDRDNSTQNEVRWKGIASYSRIRIISARLAEPLEKELYDENYRQQISNYESGFQT